MQQTERLDLINAIERGFDVWSIKHDETEIWPLIRFDLFHYLVGSGSSNSKSQEGKEKNGRSFFAGLSDIFWKSKTHIPEYLNKRRFLSLDQEHNEKLHEARFLFYGISAHRSVSVDGKYFHRITDSFSLFLEGKGSMIHLESVSSKLLVPRYSNTVLIDHLLELEWYLFSIGRRSRHNEPMIKKLYDLNRYIETIVPEYRIHPEQLILRCEKIRAYSNAFIKIMKRVKPQLFFLDIYYHDKGMAAVQAARELQIPSVEIQHGVMPPDGMGHSRWTNIPKPGLKLLPDYFWVWDDDTAQSVSLWSKGLSKHQAISGGHPFLTALHQELIKISLSDVFLEKLKSFKKVFLITLSTSSEDEYKSIQMVYNIMSAFPSDILWIFRCHPEYEVRNRQMLKMILKDSHQTNILVQGSVEENIYALLGKTSIHFTFVSTLAVEAQSFGVPTIVLGEIGLEYYRKYLEEKLFGYAGNEEHLKNVINEFIRTPVITRKIFGSGAEKFNKELNLLIQNTK